MRSGDRHHGPFDSYHFGAGPECGSSILMFNSIGGAIAIGPYKVLAERNELEYSPSRYDIAGVGPDTLIIVEVVSVYNSRELKELAQILGIGVDDIVHHRVTAEDIDNLPDPDKLVTGSGWIGGDPVPYLSRLFHELLENGCTLWFTAS